MREVIAVCRSRHSARDRVAQVLDRYLWRIGDRTWRGKASNACLDRMARELRKRASRATAVSIQEIRSSTESRMPLIRVGSRAMFSEDGLSPVASHPSAFARGGCQSSSAGNCIPLLGRQSILAGSQRGDAVERWSYRAFRPRRVLGNSGLACNLAGRVVR